jgi:hypothetical protein
MATSIVPGTPAAFPVFADAFPPTGSLLHENMYTAVEPVSGGDAPASTGPAGPTRRWHRLKSGPRPPSEPRWKGQDRHTETQAGNNKGQ